MTITILRRFFLLKSYYLVFMLFQATLWLTAWSNSLIPRLFSQLVFGIMTVGYIFYKELNCVQTNR